MCGLVLIFSGSWKHPSCSPLEFNISETYTVHIFNTIIYYNFCDNVAGYGGLTIVISNEACHDTNMSIKNTTFDNNKSQGTGGNILIAADTSQRSNTIKMENVTVSDGVALNGAGLYLYTGSSFAHDPSSEQVAQCNLNISHKLNILNANFINNLAVYGGGLYVVDLTFSRVLNVGNSVFQTNDATAAGKAMYLFSHSSKHMFENVHFFNHNVHIGIRKTTIPGIFVHKSKNVTFVDCEFYENVGTAISAVSSTPYFQGYVYFQNNTAENGGALSLFTESTILIHKGT